MTELKLAEHSTAARTIIEIRDMGILVGVIYPMENGVHIVSKYLMPDVDYDPTPPGNMKIHFRHHAGN